uniref:Small ribosomal subunit protein uS3c n=1 Tax=Chloropicon maureeniae TaxID=1461542 RepID=A0A4D6C3D4_9CHLO|nr:ribosomal protein S3 [Chloropicon maureeniae]QBX98222.1 ribosomal protein S3 [Chloropicon maureeniae]
MGQKVHPLGFRLGFTQRHSSHWYASPKEYSEYVIQDNDIRTHLQLDGVNKVEIRRVPGQVRVWLYTSQQKQILPLIEDIRNSLEKKYDVNIFFKIIQVPKRHTEAIVLAEWITDKLTRREPFRRVLRQSLQKAKSMGALGVKVQISGRLNGAEIARTEWVRSGRIPLHTLRADIDYSYQTARTLYGVLGVKVWLYSGMSLN